LGEAFLIDAMGAPEASKNGKLW